MATIDERIAEERLQIAMDLAEEAERAGNAAKLLRSTAQLAQTQDSDLAIMIMDSDILQALTARRAKCIASLVDLAKD